jgi:hypothetical protein
MKLDALLTIIGICVAAAAVGVTAWMAVETRRMAAAMKTQIEAAMRPYVTVEFCGQRSGFLSFKISNVGHSAAKQLRVKSVPEIKPVRGSGSVQTIGTIPERIGFFHESITYLGPSKSIQALIGHYSGIRASYPELLFTVSLNYEGGASRYSESVELSLKPTDDALHLQVYDIGEELNKIRKVLESMNRQTNA